MEGRALISLSNMKKLHDTIQKASTAILVAVSTPQQPIFQTREYLEELSELAATLGIGSQGTFVQSLQHPNTSTFVGSGKLEEISAFVTANNTDMVLFDDDLSPSQLRNLEEKLSCRVLDRSLLILEIFAMRAKTAQAKIQVELASHQYLLPRLTRMWTHLSRQKGGAGMQGTGEKELETDKRLIKKKIAILKEKLKVIEKQAVTQRKLRTKIARVALVGYTNVGKSTLMQCLSKENVYAENKLFATLTSTVRKVVIRDIPFLLSDTVGFIRKLPHTLIESFKSTLAEVQEADILLHVIDASHPAFEDHIKVVRETLKEIKADHIPTLLVFNKIDRIDKLDALERVKDLPSPEEDETPPPLPTWKELNAAYEKHFHEPVIFISATRKVHLDELKSLLYPFIQRQHLKIYPNYLKSHES